MFCVLVNFVVFICFNNMYFNQCIIFLFGFSFSYFNTSSQTKLK